MYKKTLILALLVAVAFTSSKHNLEVKPQNKVDEWVDVNVLTTFQAKVTAEGWNGKTKLKIGKFTKPSL